MGHRLLHQPHAARRGRPLPPRSHSGRDAGRNGPLVRRLLVFARFVTFVFLCLIALSSAGLGIGQEHYVEGVATAGSFCIADHGTSASLYVDANDYVGVVRATGDLQSDIARVTSIHPAIARDQTSIGSRAIIIGTIGKSPLIDLLIRTGKINTAYIVGKWESFLIQVVP